MNTKNLTLFLFTLFATTAIAQSTINIGLKGGANYSGFHSGDSDVTNQFGINAGAIVEFQFNEMFALQTEFLYNAKGGLFNVVNLGDNQILSIETELNYFDIPLLVKFYPNENFSIDIGPQIGFLMDSKGTLSANDGSNGEDVDLSTINKTDFALNAGFTIKFSEDLLLQARYSYGMNEVFENEPYKNSAISVSLGYYFYKIGLYR